MRKLSIPMTTYLLHVATRGWTPALDGSGIQTANAVARREWLVRDAATGAAQLTAAGWSALAATVPADVTALLDALHAKAEDMDSVASALLDQHPTAVCRVPAGTAATLTHIRSEHNWTGHQARRSALLNTTWVGEHADGAPYVTDAGYVAMGWPVSPDLIITPGGPTRVRKPGTTEPRSEVRVTAPSRPGNGTSQNWTRVLSGKRYGFTAVLMPNGERRYSVRRFDGDPGSEGFACYWTHLHFVTVPAPRITVGTVFDTPFEKGCVAQQAPNTEGGFVGLDSEGVECSFSVAMVSRVHAAPIAAAETEPTCPACGLPKTYGLANLIDGLLVCDDCASNARQISDTAPRITPVSDVDFCVGNSHALIVSQESDTEATCACGARLTLSSRTNRSGEVWVHANGKVICPGYTCSDCGQFHGTPDTAARNAVPTSAVGPITAHLASPVPAFTDNPSDTAIDTMRAEPFATTFNAAALAAETDAYVPLGSLRPYTAPWPGDSVYDAASRQHGTVHRVVSPDTVRVRWDGKHGRHLVSVSALLTDTPPCAYPGDQEHDHEMCRDAVLDAPAYPLGTYTVSDEDLWDGPAQTQSFMDQIRAEIRNSSSDDDAEAFRPTGGCA